MRRFVLDAARWVVPSHFADPSTLTFLSILGLLLRHPPLRALAWYRLACWFQARSIPGLYGLLSRWMFFRFGLEIWGEIEGGLYLPHPMGCVIAVQRMGRNCSVIASVTIGMREDYAFPVVGDHVFVGAGARVLGGITVGNHAKVGANAVVLSDVPAHGTAVGIPARIVRTNRVSAVSIVGHNGNFKV